MGFEPPSPTSEVNSGKYLSMSKFSDHSIHGASFKSTDEAVRALSGSIGMHGLDASDALRGLTKSNTDLLVQLAAVRPTARSIDFLEHPGEASIFVPDVLSHDDRGVPAFELLWYGLVASGMLLAAVWIKLGTEDRSPEQMLEGMYWLIMALMGGLAPSWNRGE